MDFSFGSMVASLFVSGIGLVLFKYGRKKGRSIFVTFGLIMMVFPYVVSDPLWMTGIAAGLSGVLYWLAKSGY